MSHSVFNSGPLTFYLFSFEGSFCFDFSSAFFFWSSGKWSVFPRIRKDKLCQSGIVDLIVAKWRDPVLACFMCRELPFYLSDAECPPFLLSCIDLCKQGTYVSAGKGDFFFSFASPRRASNNFEGTLKRQKDWDVLYYMLTNTHRLTCTQLYTNLSVMSLGGGKSARTHNNR